MGGANASGFTLLARPNVGEVVRHTVMPTISFDRHFLVTLVAILGTTISPYLWFWQASQEVEEMLGRHVVQLRSHGDPVRA